MRLICRLLRHDHTSVHVFIKYRDGGNVLLGPMDRYTADVLVVNVISPTAHWNARPVAAARIVVP